jgi:hypothetical protein
MKEKGLMTLNQLSPSECVAIGAKLAHTFNKNVDGTKAGKL